MKALAVWLLGTVYVLAVLVGMAVVVWLADHVDNGADPTHWGIGSVVVLAPLASVVMMKLGGPWIRERVGHGRGAILFGTALTVGLGVVLVVGAQALVADASACSNQDCVDFPIPVGIACVLGGWSLPLGLSTLRRVRYPAPLMSVGLVAVVMTLLAALSAAQQLSWQEDNYADLTLSVVVLVWTLPAVLGILAMMALRSPIGATEHRLATGRAAAWYLVSVGSWFMALPYVAGVDSDSLPVLLAVSGGPGLVLLAVGLVVLVPDSGPSWQRRPAKWDRRSG